MNQSIERHAIVDVIHVLLTSHFVFSSKRICRVIEITESISGDQIIYVFWCWLTLKEKTVFVFGQFKTGKGGITWNCKLVDYAKWAKKTYKLGWFGRYDIIDGQECWIEKKDVRAKIIEVHTF